MSLEEIANSDGAEVRVGIMELASSGKRYVGLRLRRDTVTFEPHHARLLAAALSHYADRIDDEAIA